VVPARAQELLRPRQDGAAIDHRPRLAGKNKSIGNRERFLRRYKEQIKRGGRARSTAAASATSSAARRSASRSGHLEPVFHHGQGGVREMVHPGNQEYVRGDRIERPKGGQGGGGSGKGQASDSGEGEDDFVFTLSKEEFMQVFFEDLALPHLVRTQLAEVPEWKSHRAGFTSDGTPNNLHVVRSDARRDRPAHRARRRPRRELRELEARLASGWKARPGGDAPGPGAAAARGDRCAARGWSASPTSTRSTCATATACACRCPPARR
jgi:uncharacterized sporulation protein YeaH/YhbH (DUF444 family)